MRTDTSQKRFEPISKSFIGSRLSFQQAKRVGNPSENKERFRTSRNDTKSRYHQSSILRQVLAKLLVIFLLSVVVILSFGSWTCADNTISITCYKDSSQIGTVTVFDWRKAASTCNMVLYDCRGECIGCFLDSDFINNVCLDMQGNEFLR